MSYFKNEKPLTVSEYFVMLCVRVSVFICAFLGFKCEWMTVRDGVLWVGGLGKEWTSTVGVVENFHPQWVKSIGHLGDIQHHDWVAKYNALREKGGFLPPGVFSFFVI